MSTNANEDDEWEKVETDIKALKIVRRTWIVVIFNFSAFTLKCLKCRKRNLKKRRHYRPQSLFQLDFLIQITACKMI